MLLNKTFYQGQSLTIGVLIADTYDTANLQSSAIIIGEKKIISTVINQMLRFELSSEDTRNFITSKTVNLVIDDAYFGRREYPLGSLSFEKTKGQPIDASIDEGYTVVFNATINEVAITIDSIMYDYVKGDKGDMEDLPAGVVIDPNYVHTDNNYTDADAQKVQSAIQTETDPNVPAWAKEPTKPTYTASEVGAEPIKSSDDNYVTDAEKTKLSNLSGTNTGDQDLSGLAPINHTHPYEPATSHTALLDKNAELTHQHIDTTSEKTTPIDADSFGLWDSVTSTFKRLSVANMLTWFRGLPHTFTQLISFSGGVKTSKIVPTSDVARVVLRNAADTADVVNVDTVQSKVSINAILVERMTNTGLSSGTDWIDTNGDGAPNGFNGSGVFSIGSTAYFARALLLGQSSFMISTSTFIATTLYEVSFLYRSTNLQIALGGGNDRNIPNNLGAPIRYTYTTTGGLGNLMYIITQSGGFAEIDELSVKDISGDNAMIEVFGSLQSSNWTYQNNGTHTGDAVGDRRYKVVNGILVTQGCTVANATRGLGTWVNVGVQLSDNTATASVYFEGCKRYRKDSNNSYEETCMQVGATSYAWVIIKQNTWS